MLYIRMMFSMLVSLYTSRVVLNTLGVEDFGIYNVVSGIIIMFVFINGAMANGTMRFITYELGRGDKVKLSKVFNSALITHIILALFVLLLAETIGLWFLNSKMNIPHEKMYAANWVYQFSVFSAIISMTQVPYTTLIMGHERMKVYANVGILEVLLRLIIVYFLVVVPFNKLIFYSFLVTVTSFLIASIYRLYCIKQFEESKFQFYLDKGMLIEMSSFAGWNLLGSAANIGTKQGVNVILNIVFGPIINAAFGVAGQVNGAISLFGQNFMTAIKPQIIKSYASQENDYFQSLLRRGSKFTFFLLLYLCIPVTVETEYILNIWLKNYPDFSVQFTRLILVYTLLYGFNDVFFLAVQASGKIKRFQIVTGFFTLFYLPVIYFVLKMSNNPDYSFYVMIIGTSLLIPIGLMLTKNVIPFFNINEYVVKALFPCIIVFSISYLSVSYISNFLESNFINLLVLIFASSVIISVLILLFALDSNERKYLKNTLIKLRQRIWKNL